MSDQKSPCDLAKMDSTPLHPDEIKPLLRQVWEFINDQRMIVHIPRGESKWEESRYDAGRDKAFRLVLAFITGAADSNLDGRLRDIDDSDRIQATIDAEKEFQL